ncbi:hypothetical protein LCGC14_1887040 [marine sediment metagenome]|uniref:Uncharacterized protein n=1 Tax=marine sediment metagenome TaxID=412755 RepID=A0A0F9IEE4_9ZZZZ
MVLKRLLLILLVCLLTLYAPIELTRVILDWEGFSNKFIFEIAFMWFPYVGAISILSVVVFRKLHKEQKT